MNTQENGKTNVLTLPPEVWSSITSYIPGEQLGRLKFTGSKLLWARLCQMRSVESVNLGTDYLIFKSWPAFLKELPDIRELTIDNKDEYWSHFWQPVLTDLPSSLRKLKISLIFRKVVRLFGKARGLSNHFPLLESLDLDVVWGAKYTWLAEMPPSLTDLKIHGWDGTLALPTTLVRLRVAQLPLSLALPPLPHLEFLEFPYVNNSPVLPRVVLANLSSRLHTLIYEATEAWSPSEVEMIPKYVTRLESLAYFPEPTDGGRFTLPPFLTSLRLSRLHPKHWSCLPNTLQRFTLGQVLLTDAIANRTLVNPSTGYIIPVAAYPIEALPRSITKLNLVFGTNRGNEPAYLCAPSESSSYDPQKPQNLFPPALVSLRLEKAQLSVEAAKQMPASLTSLSMSFLHRKICEVLPPHLRKLRANFAAVDEYFFNCLPKSLTKLSIAAENPTSASWRNSYTGRKVTSEAAIPGYSQFSSLKAFSRVWAADSCLSNLIRLHLTDFKADLEPLVTKEAKLDKLEELHISNPNLLNICFPRNLKRLSLQRCLVSSGFYTQLPRSLTSLMVVYTEAPLFDEDIKDLPPKLEYMTIHSGKQLTDACVKDLPRTLRFCSLKASFTAAAIQDLPPLLVSRTANTGLQYCFPPE